MAGGKGYFPRRKVEPGGRVTLVGVISRETPVQIHSVCSVEIEC